MSATPATYEETHVHAIYEQIAPHFSLTRHKPWPIISAFLTSLPPGSLVLDAGCGNGKYLPLNNQVFILASDRSVNLARIASQHRHHSVVVADILALPHGDGVFDAAVSVAVVHHLSTRERRVEALAEILRTVREGGKALVYCWAVEQEGSRRGWKEGDKQDVMVPWVMRGKKGEAGLEERVFQRYYHLYQKGELEGEVREAGGWVVESGYEKDNWWAVFSNRPP